MAQQSDISGNCCSENFAISNLFILLEDLILSQFSYKIFIITSINKAADRTSITIIIFRTAAISWKKTFYRCLATCLRMPQRSWHCEKSVQIRSFIGQYFPIFGLNREKYGTEKTRYLDTFQVVVTSSKIHVISKRFKNTLLEKIKIQFLVISL